MSIKSIFPCALVLAVAAAGASRAQERLLYPAPQAVSAPSAPAAPPAEGAEPSQPGQTEWIRYSRPNCCGQIGGDGPISSELYFQAGLAFPMGGGPIPHSLNSAGWMVQGGGRVLFFNPEADKAWVVNLGGSVIRNYGDSDLKIPLFLLFPQINPLTGQVTRDPVTGQALAIRRNIEVTLREVTRTYFNFGAGRDWYLWAPANSAESKWRVGIELGGRIGAGKAEFNEINHRNDNLWGAYVSAHSDWEWPCGACTYVAGLRFDWGYSWWGILQKQNDADITDINLLFNVGVRF